MPLRKAGQSKIQDFDITVGGTRNVARLEVTVDDASTVQVQQPTRNLIANKLHLIQRKLLAFGNLAPDAHEAYAMVTGSPLRMV